MAANSRITGREKQVLRLIVKGMTNKEIATELRISPHTVARHLQKIFIKLGVLDRFEASDKAQQMGILNLEGPEK